MKPVVLVLALASLALRVCADSVVVFNELHYHPASDAARSEWIELKNQLSIDVDLSGWSIQEDVRFTFPEGTLIRGRDHLVVALDPVALAAATLRTNITGPFEGRLPDGGGRLVLRNNQQRLMDELVYGATAPWPATPDGQGPSLARRRGYPTPGVASGWAPSLEAGGTPGRENFPSPSVLFRTNTIFSINQTWKWPAEGVSVPADWFSSSYDDSGWSVGAAPFQAGDSTLPVPVGTRLPAGPATRYFRTQWDSGASMGPFRLALRGFLHDGAVGYLNGVEVFRHNMPPGPVLPDSAARSDSAPEDAVAGIAIPAERVLSGRNLLSVEVHQGLRAGGYARAVLASRPLAYWRLDETNGPAPDESQVGGLQEGSFAGLAATNRLAPGPRPGDLVGGRPMLGFSGANLATRFAGNTEAGNDVMIVRDPGLLGFESGRAFTLEAWVNGPAIQESGAGLIAKGAGGGGEQYALDLVAGKYRLFTRDASGLGVVSSVSAPDGPGAGWQHIVGVVDPAAGVMRIHVNGVERASGPSGGSLLPTAHDVSIGARKQASDPYDLNFNGRMDEVAIYDRALSAAEIQGHFDAAFEAFTPPTVDTNEMAMALELVAYERVPAAEIPEPAPAGQGVSAQDRLVINEIHYHPKDRMPMAATYSNAVLVTFSNIWQHHTLGTDLGSAWRINEANDGGWQSSPAPFHAPANLGLPLPKQTSLSLSNAAQQRISTFYFRTQFAFSGRTNGVSLSLRTLLDDAAVYYLNGVEILRLNLPAGPIGYTNLSASAVSSILVSAPRSLQVSNLVDGINTLSVEVHQASGNPVDMAFATELSVVHEVTPELALEERPGSWIELFNRGTEPVNLTRCRLAGGIEYAFPAGRIVSPGGYLVVAKDPAYFRSVYPGVPVTGPFGGRLSKGGDSIELLDALGQVMDRVHYLDDGRWPRSADGGGSSLELVNPFADNTSAESWAPSLESHRAGWETFRWRGIARPGQAEEPNLWHELAFCLIEGGGEVLLDDISVLENPATVPKQLMWNGGFDGGSIRSWRFMGNHRHSEAIPDPEDPSNWVLRLVSSGAGEYQGNQIETTFTNNLAVVDGREYEVSFRARWVSGASLLNTRIYFNRLSRTIALPIREGGGTPGARNSRYAAVVGPTFEGLSHFPVAPDPGEPVRIRVRASDPDGMRGCTLHYRVGTQEWREGPMDGSVALGFEGYVPGLPAGAVVQFYVEGVDETGGVAFAPAAGPASRALYVVNDGQVLPPPIHSLRVLMTPPDAAFLHTETNTLSNELLGSTVIEDNEHVYYDVGVRLKGSFVGRNVPRVGFNLQFGSGRPFRGVHDSVAVDKAFHTGIGNVSELVLKHIAGHAGGIPTMNDDLAWFIAPVASYTSMSTLRLSGFDSAWLDAQFPSGSDGGLFEVEVIRWNLATINGRPEGLKQVGNESGGTGYANLEVANYGDDRESYRWFTLAANNRDQDDFRGVMEWCKTLSLTSTNLDLRSQQTMDVDQWLRVLAYQTLVGPGDAYFTGGNIHNFRVYVRPGDGRVLYFPWDWDSSFQIDPSSPLIGGGNIANLVSIPHNRRVFLNHVHDIVSSTFNRGYMSRWIKHYAALGRQDLSAVETYIASRAAFALTQVPTNTAFAITNNGGADFASTTNQLVLAGTAPIMVRSLEVNGTVYPVTWAANTAWRLQVPLAAGVNVLSVQGITAGGVRLPAAMDSITVTNLAPSALRPVVINEWMADNSAPGGFPDPVDGLFQDWFELYNPNASSVDLSGFFLTDDLSRPSKWRVPDGRRMLAGEHLVVWADNQTQQNTADGSGPLHAAFQLSAGGEAIALFSPGGLLQHAVRFGAQVENVSQGLFPDGATNQIRWMPDASPGAINRSGSRVAPTVQALRVLPGGGVELTFGSVAGLGYWVEYSPVLVDASWRRVASTGRTVGAVTTIGIGGGDQPSGFYRVHLDLEVPPLP